MTQFNDILLDEDLHDIVVSGGDLKLVDVVDDAITQRLRITLKTFKAEWFLNINFGIPYYQSILKKDVTKGQVDNIFRNEILKVEGVSSITDFKSDFQRSSREYTLTFSCKTTSEENITITI